TTAADANANFGADANATNAAQASMSGEVNVTSSPGNSISSNYHVDFGAMDANGDGNISRGEAKGNPDLTREFKVVDSNHNGRLSRDEMKGWID
ncbi:MAG TPA: EF-hand domain-containing protein, partial [Xanthomonadaceae bacterium]|nr:EF-hand domain-containing protein [Xanthomonadaceae bacterium]